MRRRDATLRSALSNGARIEVIVTGIALLATVAFWASAFAGIRAGLVAYSPGHLVLLRFLIASAVFILYAAATRLRPPARPDLPGILVIGLCGYTGYQLALSSGERTVSAGIASLLVNTAPLFTALLAVGLLHERLRPAGWVGLSIGFAGTAIITGTDADGLRLDSGIALICGAAILHSLHFTLQKPYLRRYRPLELTAYTVWAGTLPLLGFAPGLIEAVGAAPASATLAIVYLGVFPAALANVAWAFVLSRMAASRAASYLYLAPGCAFVIGWLWLGVLPTFGAIVGGAIALAGVIVVNIWGKSSTVEPAR